jgi:hypothetical protein
MEKHTIIKLKNEGYPNRQVEKMIGINRKIAAKYCTLGKRRILIGIKLGEVLG